MNLWVVDDEPGISMGLKKAFEGGGVSVKILCNIATLRTALESDGPDIVLLDNRLPDGCGVDELPHILKATPEAKVIIMTAYGESALVVRAIRQGAFNYLDKPFPLEGVRQMVQQAADSLRLTRTAACTSMNRQSMVGSRLGPIRDTLSRIAGQGDLNMLILGESGTGKDVVANLVHASSGCRGAFVPLNCAAIPEALLETEFFGHRRGAYTGATEDKMGLVELAADGTLFLDEIGDMPMGLQGKVLRFLDNRTYRPVGGAAEKTVSLNVVCATSLNLQEAASEGRFRKDLYYRISTLPIEVPPLRSRGRDVLELAAHFLAVFAAKRGRKAKSLSREAEELFLEYHWPGNVRELKNLLERVTILSDPDAPMVGLQDIPEHMCGPDIVGTGGLHERMELCERRFLTEALEACGGNRTGAAKYLGISRFALLRRLQRHGFA